MCSTVLHQVSKLIGFVRPASIRRCTDDTAGGDQSKTGKTFPPEADVSVLKETFHTAISGRDVKDHARRHHRRSLSWCRSDGTAATRRIKEHALTRHIPVIIFTAFPHQRLNTARSRRALPSS